MCFLVILPLVKGLLDHVWCATERGIEKLNGLTRNTARSHALPTGDVPSGVSSNWGIPEGAGQPIATVPVDPEPSHASRVGRNYLHFSQVYQIPIL